MINLLILRLDFVMLKAYIDLYIVCALHEKDVTDSPKLQPAANVPCNILYNYVTIIITLIKLIK